MIKSDKILVIFRSPLTKMGKQFIWGIMVCMTLLGIFAKLAEDVLHNKLKTFDTIVGNFVYSFTEPGLTKAAIFITTLGSAYVEIPLLLAAGGWLLFRYKHTWETVILAISLAGGGLLNTILKDFFRRSRPDIRHLVEAGGYSFPSGHAMVAASFYGMLGYLVWLNLRKQSKRSWYVIVITVALIFMIGLSRIYLGVHFPSDVIAGFAAGGAWLVTCIIGLHTIHYYKSDK
jgi:undecaprenyl-diphosphatase